MLISKVLNDSLISDEYLFINEKHFYHLGLTDSMLDRATCVFIDDEKYINSIKGNVSMIITTQEIYELTDYMGVGFCIVQKPREVFFRIHNYVSTINKTKNITSTSIGKNCRISEQASIANNNVIIGDNVVIEEFVVIREGSKIGDNTIIRAHSVIGGQGYEFKRVDEGILSVEHAGGVIIGKNVEVQYNTCIDKGVYEWDNTVIGDNCKIDNLVHIAHGVKIGNNTMIVANSGIGGRVEIGNDTWIGFGVTITNGVKVGDESRANIGAVVTKSIPSKGSVTGNFAIDHMLFIKELKNKLKVL